jgi:hypothetical protein
MDVQVFVPDKSGNYGDGLVAITMAIEEKKGEQEGYGLGGPSGYGSNYENDVFMMHRYCWCEREGCAWCDGEAPNFFHKPSGLAVTWYKYIGRGEEIENGVGFRKWAEIVNECIKSVDADPRTREEIKSAEPDGMANRRHGRIR